MLLLLQQQQVLQCLMHETGGAQVIGGNIWSEDNTRTQMHTEERQHTDADSSIGGDGELCREIKCTSRETMVKIRMLDDAKADQQRVKGQSVLTVEDSNEAVFDHARISCCSPPPLSIPPHTPSRLFTDGHPIISSTRDNGTDDCEVSRWSVFLFIFLFF